MDKAATVQLQKYFYSRQTSYFILQQMCLGFSSYSVTQNFGKQKRAQGSPKCHFSEQ